ncbi:MAG TPA: hypothetical protein GX692_08185 [Acholeplasmataceae bacterium]|jgi:hypothetical protein|nr:hypothetical protein [Acholeplasmataceae bacterium]
MKLLVIIINREFAEKYTNILNKESDKFQFVLLGQGTASSEILDYFGLARKDKAVIICLLTEAETPTVLDLLNNEKEFHRPGGAVAFTVKLTNINKHCFDLVKSLSNKLENNNE